MLDFICLCHKSDLPFQNKFWRRQTPLTFDKHQPNFKSLLNFNLPSLVCFGDDAVENSKWDVNMNILFDDMICRKWYEVAINPFPLSGINKLLFMRKHFFFIEERHTNVIESFLHSKKKRANTGGMVYLVKY